MLYWYKRVGDGVARACCRKQVRAYWYKGTNTDGRFTGTNVLVMASLALAAESRCSKFASGGGGMEVSAAALQEAVGVVAMVDRSCRHTPLQQTLHSALLRLLAASA